MAETTRRIVAAANRYGPVTLVGVRHGDLLMVNQAEHMPYFNSIRDKHQMEQGFVDNYGNFVDREEAMVIVKASGQPFYPERNGCAKGKRLFSEGVW